MFENITNFLKKLTKKQENTVSNSKEAAKERLHLVLMQDRANVSADFLELMKQEIIEVIKKYNIEKIVAEDVHPETYGYSDTSRLLMWLQGAVMLGAHEVNSSFTSKTLELM